MSIRKYGLMPIVGSGQRSERTEDGQPRPRNAYDRYLHRLQRQNRRGRRRR